MSRAFTKYTSSLYGTQTQAIITETSSTGLMNAFLVHDASVSFWRFRFARHTYFATERKVQTLESGSGISQQNTITIERGGDMLNKMYLMVTRPGIRAYVPEGLNNSPLCAPCADVDQQFYGNYAAANGSSSNNLPVDGLERWRAANYGAAALPAPLKESNEESELEHYVHYTNAFGFVLVREATLKTGTAAIGVLNSTYMFLYEEFTGKSGKRLGEEIGKYDTQEELIASSAEDQILIVPLYFPNHTHTGHSISSTSLTGCPISLTLVYEDLEKLVCKSHPSIQAINNTTNAPLAKNDFRVSLLGDWIHLDIAERNMYVDAEYDNLWKWVTTRKAFNNKSNEISFDVKVQNNIIEFMWVLQRECNAARNYHTDFSGLDGRDPITEATIMFGSDIKIRMPARYFRTTQPLEHHSSKPTGFAYCFSIALNPEDVQPSGSLSTAGIPSITLELSLQEGLQNENVQATCCIVATNIMRYQKEVAGLVLAP